jgi:hypothetical protein
MSTNDEEIDIDNEENFIVPETKSIKHFDDGSDRNVAFKASARATLENDIKKFLAQGGNIEKVDAHITADPPKRPSTQYGSRPI